MKHFRKIYYVPGLISAIIIPILFWYYGSQKYKEINVGVIDIGLPAKIDSSQKWSYEYSFEPLRNWNYKKIVVRPNTARINSDFYISEIKELQNRNQKETGIEFVLSIYNSYDDFVSILSDFNLAKQEMWALDLNKTGNLFAIIDYKDPNKISRGYDVVYGNDNMYYMYKESDYYEGFQKFSYQASQLPKQSFYIIFGYLILLNVSMLSIEERFLNKKKIAFRQSL